MACSQGCKKLTKKTCGGNLQILIVSKRTLLLIGEDEETVSESKPEEMSAIVGLVVTAEIGVAWAFLRAMDEGLDGVFSMPSS